MECYHPRYAQQLLLQFIIYLIDCEDMFWHCAHGPCYDMWLEVRAFAALFYSGKQYVSVLLIFLT
jgi:hypothetical protein